MSVRIERVSDASQLSPAVLDQWSRLPVPSPMQSAEWLLGWWRTIGQRPGNQLCLLLIWEGDRLLGVAPWYLRQTWVHGRCLRFLGDGIACSDYATVAIHPGAQLKVLRSLVEWLRTSATRCWHSLQFEAIAGDNPTLRALTQQTMEADCALHTHDTQGCWTVELPASWEDYLAALSKNHRKRCRRWQRNYFDTGRAQVTLATVEECKEYWDALTLLNLQRRALLGDRSAFVTPQFHAFHLSVLPQLLAQGRAELRQLRIDGAVRAMEYVLLQEGTVFCYQSGMSTIEQGDGWGNLSLLALFHDALHRGYQRVDFLRGDESYKQHWGAQRRPCIDTTVTSGCLQGRAKLAYHHSRDWLRELRDTWGSWRAFSTS